MPAYVIADIEVTDPARYDEYRKLAGPAVQKYGGRYLVRGGAHEVLEGDWSPKRVVLLEFPSAAQARAFYHSPEYAAARAARTGASHSNLIVVEGAW